MGCRVAICLLVATYCVAADISSPTRFREQSFDVVHYDASIALDSLPNPVLAESKCRFTVIWRDVPDTLRFHMRGLNIHALVYKQSNQTIPVQWYVRGQPSQATFHYAVPALPSHKQGDTIILEITYSGRMSGEPPIGGYSWGGVQQEGPIVYALGVGFYNNYVSTTAHWLPCYDHPSDKATAELRFRVPASYVIASNGQELPRSDSGNWSIYHFRTLYPIATYLLTFAAVPRASVAIIRDSTSLPVPIVLYARRSDSSATARSFRLLPAMVRAFERRFGTYPFEKVGYVMTQKGAMEHQTMISYPTSLARSRDTVNLVAAHELAHQWFGDCVTPYDFRDAWFNESFATFCEALWLEELGGIHAYLNELQRKINAYFNQYAKPGNPLFEGILTMYDFDRTPPSSNYPHVIYEKGAAVLGMLRALWGDTIFFQWCRSLLQKFRYHNVSIDTVQHALGVLVGSGFASNFFDQWIRGKGWPILSIDATKESTPHGWKSVVRIKQVQPDSFGVYTTLPLELSFVGSDTSYRAVVITAREQIFVWDSLADFQDIQFNQGPSVRSLALLSSVPSISTIEPHAFAADVRVAPNPASDIIWIDAFRMAPARIAVATITGNIIARFQASSMQVFDTSSLSSGVYYIIIEKEAHRIVIPFLILR